MFRITFSMCVNSILFSLIKQVLSVLGLILMVFWLFLHSVLFLSKSCIIINASQMEEMMYVDSIIIILKALTGNTSCLWSSTANSLNGPHIVMVEFLTSMCDYLRKNCHRESVQSLLSNMTHTDTLLCSMFLHQMQLKKKKNTAFSSPWEAQRCHVNKANFPFVARRCFVRAWEARDLISMHGLAGLPWWKLSFKNWAAAINRARKMTDDFICHASRPRQ